ncbi:MAG: hypothetical protein M1817_006811 [Caeruleum heppii]|nr:MAG: hypothetical protein M1817_006811 [Caeruleum heppii]
MAAPPQQRSTTRPPQLRPVLICQVYNSPPPPPPPDSMASLEIDQKYLGRFAKSTTADNAYLSSMLYKILGLSVLLSRKSVRARRLRKLDTTRDTKSLQLYHHIIWLSREGLVIVEQYIIPMVQNYGELKVLAYKLRASFYHIFVLFHNNPPATQAAIPGLTSGQTGSDPAADKGKLSEKGVAMNGGPVGGHQHLPPGLAPVSVPKPTGSFLLPAIDYIPMATSCFSYASSLSDDLLSGSHPLRLSVKLEYCAFLYDCLKDGDGSRRLAKRTVTEVYRAQEGMDDEMFEDAADLVGVLGKMMKRGLHSGTPTSGGGSSSTATPGSRATPKMGGELSSRSGNTPRFSGETTPKMGPPPIPAVPLPAMANPI